MAVTSGKQFPVGMRHARLYELDASGYINAVDENAYEGLQLVAAKAFEMTVPDARRITHTGDDRILAQDVLPRLEPSTAILRVGRNDHDVYALLTGTEAFTIGESAGIGYATDKQGFEPDVGVLLYQQSLDAVAKVRRYRAYMMPVSKAIINPANMNDDVVEYQFNLLPQIVNHHLWKLDFELATEGFTEAEILEFMTEDIPHVVAWRGDNTTVNFLFHTDRQAVATTKIHVVTEDGVDVTGTITKATTGITFTTAPATDSMIACYYEYAD